MQFMPQSRRELIVLAFWFTGLAAFSFFIIRMSEPALTAWLVLPAMLVVFVSALMCGLIVLSLEREKVDPWALQRKLMQISGQALPGTMQINPDSLRYIGLICEELEEMITPVGRTLYSFRQDRLVEGRRWVRPTPGIEEADQAIAMIRKNLVAASHQIKDACERMHGSFVIPLDRATAVELADGATDLMVVAAGFAEASAIPGAMCYREVQGSNLSKADPETGQIEKDRSGKWKKGRDYRPPNLGFELDVAGVLGHLNEGLDHAAMRASSLQERRVD